MSRRRDFVRCGRRFCSLKSRCTKIPQGETTQAGGFFCLDTSDQVSPFWFCSAFSESCSVGLLALLPSWFSHQDGKTGVFASQAQPRDTAARGPRWVFILRLLVPLVDVLLCLCCEFLSCYWRNWEGQWPVLCNVLCSWSRSVCGFCKALIPKQSRHVAKNNHQIFRNVLNIS